MTRRPGPRARFAGAVLAVLALPAALARAHSPHDVVHELALSPAFAADRTLFASVTLTDNALFAVSRDAGRSWTYLGTPLAAPKVGNFAFSPDFAADGMAFAANPASGVWRTTDGGQSWQPASAGLAGTTVLDVACSPGFAADRTLLAATSAGAFLSQDAGETWTPQLAGLQETSIRRVALALDANGDLAAFAAGAVLHRSLELGPWLALGSFPQRVESLAVSPQFATDARLAVSFGRFGLGVALSEDGGASFAFQNEGLTDLFVEEVALAADGTRFAATDTAGCFRALPGEGAWTLVVDGFEPLSDLTAVHHTEVVVSPDFASDRTVYVGAFEGLYRSFEAGDAWQQLDVYSQRLNRRFVVPAGQPAESHLLAGNYGGGAFLYRRSLAPGPGPASGPSAAGLSAAPSGAAPPTAGGALAGAPALAGAGWRARNDSCTTPWSAVLVASPGPPGARQLLYGYSKLLRSDDEGLTWIPLVNPLTPGAVVRALGLSPAWDLDGTVFLGSGADGSFRSTDQCATWQPLAGLPATLTTTAIAVSPGFRQDLTVFFASRDFGLWRSTDGGDAWSPSGAGLPDIAVSALALSPAFDTDDTLFAGTFADGVWTSADRGDSWSAVNAGFPAGVLRVESLALSPAFAQDGTLFAALQDHGVWRSTDAGASWQAPGPGLAGPPVELAVSDAFALDRTVIAGTFGGTCISRDAGATWELLRPYVFADDKHPSLRYSAGWTTVGDGPSACGTLTGTETPGATCELEFHGQRVSWWAQRGPQHGIAHVSLDGGPPVAVDTWAEQLQPGSELFRRSFAEPGWHVIRVTHSGLANPASGGSAVLSDGFEHEG